MEKARDPSRRTSRRYRWAILAGFLLWLGIIAGGMTYAYTGSGTGTFTKRISCTQGELCYYDTGQCNSQYVALPNDCTNTSGGGGGGGSTSAPQPSGGTFCWAQPSGGHNATVNGYPGYLASCAPATPPANVCTPNGTLKMVPLSCTGSCHEATWQQYNSCGSKNGGTYTSYDGHCTSGCAAPPPTNTCSGTWHWAQIGCVAGSSGMATWADIGPCGNQHDVHPGTAKPGTCIISGSGSGGGSTTTSNPTPTSTPPAPSCTPSASTSYGGTSWTGCASQGVESGTQSYTVYHSCPSYTSYGSRTLTQSTSTTCQSVVEHQCAYAKPGYAQSETCLTSPLGGTTNCSGWSTPYYDPHGCPIPTPVN